MSAYVVTVEFLLKPGMRAAFRPLIDANARASAREEAGCRRFDVLFRISSDRDSEFVAMARTDVRDQFVGVAEAVGRFHEGH